MSTVKALHKYTNASPAVSVVITTGCTKFDYLIVGSGGYQGYSNNPGGGGGGGAVVSGSVTTNVDGTYKVFSRDLGGIQAYLSGSTIGQITAAGGGDGRTSSAGQNGACGGGGGGDTATSYAGGIGSFGGDGGASSPDNGGGGGGASGADGQSGGSGRAGGAGITSSISGAAIEYGRGGNGGSASQKGDSGGGYGGGGGGSSDTDSGNNPTYGVVYLLEYYDTTPDTAFVSTWDTTKTSAGSSNNNQVKLPLVNGGTYDFTVNWGDDTYSQITSWNQAETTHTYAATGSSYVITIMGTCTGWRFNGTGDRLKIKDISQWGTLNLGNAGDYFQQCSNLDITATDILDLAGTTNLSDMFNSCTSLIFNSSINDWDVSNVTKLAGAFSACYLFNQPLDNWDVSNVTTLYSTFSNCRVFNQNINGWDISNVNTLDSTFSNCWVFNQPLDNWVTNNVTTLRYTFMRCYKFNQDISDWITSKVTILLGTFYYASEYNQPLNTWNTSAVTTTWYCFANAVVFNQPLDNWVTSNVDNMGYMFNGATVFNQDISGWNTSKVTTLDSTFGDCDAFNINLNGWDTRKVNTLLQTFSGAHSFNQPLDNWITSGVTNMQATFQHCHLFNYDISTWNTSKVTTFYAMFNGAYVFNQDIGGWDTRKCTKTEAMFVQCYDFNQDLSAWVTSGVTSMEGMFNSASSFNQDIGSWNTSKVTNFKQIFYHATAFNQDLSAWDFTKDVTASNWGTMFRYSGLSRENYDALLYNWANSTTPSSVTFYLAQNYCDYISHDYLDTTKSWTFVDNGLDSGCSGAPSGLTATLVNNCEVDFTWTIPGAYDSILLQNFGSWNTIATLAGNATSYTWTGSPAFTSDIFRVVGVISGTSLASDSIVGEIPPAISSTVVRNAQCGPFDYSSGRIIYLFANLLSGHTYTFSVYRDDLSLYYQQTGMTSTDDFFVDNVPDGCYLGEISDVTCGCTVDVQQYCVQSILPFALGGCKKLYITPWTSNVDFNYWSTADEDYYLSSDSSFFLSTKIKEYLSLSGGNLTWYEIPVLPQVVSVNQSLAKVRQGFIFTDTLNFGIAKANADKWTKISTIINPENKWVYVLQDADNNWWTGGFMHGGKITTYNYKTGSRGEDNGYGLTIQAVSENKILTALDAQYVIDNIQ